MTREVKAMAGSHITLMATIKGVPFPTVAWKKNDAEVPPRADIETSQADSKLVIRFCTRADCGDYTLTVENPAGSKTATCTVLVLGERYRNFFGRHSFAHLFQHCLVPFPDKPGPIQHLRVSDVRSDSAYLSWKDPEDNGGTRITNFVVEKKDTASTQWVPVCSTSKKRSMMLKHLMEGTAYSFRVAAENQYGRSEYVETPKAIKAMNPLCE